MSDAEVLRLQKQQLDALSHIYLDDLQLVRPTNPIKLSINNLKIVKCCDNSEYESKIHFEFFKNYPKNPPRIEIEPIRGITQNNIVAMEKRVDELLNFVANRPIVYDVVEMIRDWIQEFLVEGKDQIQEDQSSKPIVEIFERPKFATYTPVNAQNFMNWKRAFDQEMLELKKKKKQQMEQKLTGKQWFLKNKQHINQESEEDEEDDSSEQA